METDQDELKFVPGIRKNKNSNTKNILNIKSNESLNVDEIKTDINMENIDIKTDMDMQTDIDIKTDINMQTDMDIKTDINMENMGEQDYTYIDMLSMIYSNLGETDQSDKKLLLTKPNVSITKNKTCISNYVKLCSNSNINNVYLTNYFETELCSIVRIVEGKLIINGRYKTDQIESIIRKYASIYMRCGSCKSYNTTLAFKNKLFMKSCSSCKSEYSVSSIKRGFQAKTRYN